MSEVGGLTPSENWELESSKLLRSDIVNKCIFRETIEVGWFLSASCARSHSRVLKHFMDMCV